MNIIVAGAGAIGGTVAVLLKEAGRSSRKTTDFFDNFYLVIELMYVRGVAFL